MAENLSAEQARERDTAIMGPTLGPLYHALADEVAWLQVKWSQYRQLYAHSLHRVELLNKAGGQFFLVVQVVLWEDVLLGMARLTDSPGSGKKARLTLRTLARAIPDAELSKEVAKLSAAAEAPFVRDYRDRWLAHSDLGVALERDVKPLPEISRQNVEKALTAIRAVLNRIEVHYYGSPTSYEDTIAGLGEAEAVVMHLRTGLRAERARFERLKQGRAAARGPRKRA